MVILPGLQITNSQFAQAKIKTSQFLQIGALHALLAQKCNHALALRAKILEDLQLLNEVPCAVYRHATVG